MRAVPALNASDAGGIHGPHRGNDRNLAHPTIGFALDGKKQEDPVWKPIFEAYEPIKAWLKEKQPDVLFLIYNDHVTSFFFDHYSAFVLGVGEEWKVADEGGGHRKLPPDQGPARSPVTSASRW
ncbi:MAG: hypothetical protein WDN45_19255 [Caulobacteraceae bacterium]